MHNYETCPSNDHNPAPHMPQRGPADYQPRFSFAEISGDTSEVSSIDLDLSVPGDHLDATHPSPQVDLGKAPGQLERPHISEERLIEPFRNGYTKWKAAWRLQTIIVSLYILGKYKPARSSAMTLCLLHKPLSVRLRTSCSLHIWTVAY
jgi:hypothetical protein